MYRWIQWWWNTGDDSDGRRNGDGGVDASIAMMGQVVFIYLQELSAGWCTHDNLQLHFVSSLSFFVYL